ncbi:CAP domain-containing protein [Psychrobacillus sp. FJAT-21963]|uniref:CAP domain-containing protein n=1 Tax=Psychrobacillus sp. FJAT-21963 TaxID=1712028 RepID=UPI0009E93F70|nr:CAP domain-containing protein [Psychrobacillus sp. FJAT-21963]
MNKNYSLIVGLLAGSLLFTTQSVEASMSTGNSNSNTTSEANISVKQKGNEPFSNINKNNQPIESTKPVTTKQEASTQKSGPSTNDVGQVSSTVQQVVDLTNQERAKEGLKALQIDVKLTQSAQEKSQDMKNKNYFSHTSPTYGSPFDQMKALGITYNSAGENIAMGQPSAEEVVEAWMKSPGHRENIMNPSFTHIGVGLSDSGFYWTQQFIGK